MKWIIPLSTGGVIIAPFAIASVVSLVSPYFILDNPEFWYYYMGYIGTVALAGAALWQNQSFRLESRRKEEYAIRPYLFSKIEPWQVDHFENCDGIEFIQVSISENGLVLGICGNRNKPKEVIDYFMARQKHRDFLRQPALTNRLSQIREETDLLMSEISHLNTIKQKYEFLVYSLENHGAGSAVKIEMTLNSQPFVPLFCLSHAEKKELYFLMEVEQLKPGTMARFDITTKFYNVEDFGPYRQEESFSVCKTEAEEIALMMEKQISSPVLEKKEATKDGKT